MQYNGNKKKLGENDVLVIEGIHCLNPKMTEQLADENKFKIYITERFGVAKDQFNMVHPDRPIKADAIRINMIAQKDACVGILEATIE